MLLPYAITNMTIKVTVKCKMLLVVPNSVSYTSELVSGYNNNNNNNNVFISIAQNTPSSVVLTAVQTNMSLVFQQKSAEKRMQSECQLANCYTQEDQRPQSCVYSTSSWNNEISTVSRPKVPSIGHSCDRHTVVKQHALLHCELYAASPASRH